MIRTVVISDLHGGSQWGLWPDKDMLLPDGREVPLNKGQKYLLKCWEDCQRRVRDLKPSILVLNGDLIDGEQRAQGGTEAMTTLTNVQVKAATKLLSPFAEMVREVYSIEGTEYHDARAGQAVEAVARAVGAIGPNPDWHSWEFLDLEVDGVTANFSHGISVAQGLYRVTPLDREGVWSAIAGKEGKMPKADIVVRSHVHHFAHVEHPTKHIVVTPCWQLQTRYMRRNSVYRMLPDIGVIIIEMEPAAKKAKEDPITVRKILYALPVVEPRRSGVASGLETEAAV